MRPPSPPRIAARPAATDPAPPPATVEDGAAVDATGGSRSGATGRRTGTTARQGRAPREAEAVPTARPWPASRARRAQPSPEATRAVAVDRPRRAGSVSRRRPGAPATESPVPPAPRGWAGSALSRLASAPGVVSTRFAERLTERRAARRRVRLVRFAALAATCAVAAALAWLVLSSSVLALSSEDLDITTSGPAADPELVAAALQPWEGTPLARLRTAELESSVEDVPGVRSASVHRSWPNGLTVDVEARVPVVAVAVAGRHALLDVDAVQVGDRVDAVPEGIPVVSLPAGRSTEALSAVLAVLDALPPGLADEIARVSAESNDTVSFRLADGSQVRWGSAELAELKGRVLEVLRQRPAQLYDVSAPTMPVTR